MRERIYPDIGHFPLHKLNRMMYQKYINSLATGRNKLSAGSIKILSNLVRSCLGLCCVSAYHGI